jgi:serine O-acetyltransferase
MGLRDSKLLKDLGDDLRRYWAPELGKLGNLKLLAMQQATWATVVYRYGRWVYERPRPLAGPAAKALYQLAQKAVEVTTGICIPASADIGPGLYIGHFGSIILNGDTRMGSGCSIGQNVTIGTRGQGREGAPVIGDGVYIGAGAKVLGDIRIGDGASIGANAVVVKDVPPGAVAVGVPATIRKKK